MYLDEPSLPWRAVQCLTPTLRRSCSRMASGIAILGILIRFELPPRHHRRRER